MNINSPLDAFYKDRDIAISPAIINNRSRDQYTNSQTNKLTNLHTNPAIGIATDLTERTIVPASPPLAETSSRHQVVDNDIGPRHRKTAAAILSPDNIWGIEVQQKKSDNERPGFHATIQLKSQVQRQTYFKVTIYSTPYDRLREWKKKMVSEVDHDLYELAIAAHKKGQDISIGKLTPRNKKGEVFDDIGAMTYIEKGVTWLILYFSRESQIEIPMTHLVTHGQKTNYSAAGIWGNAIHYPQKSRRISLLDCEESGGVA